MMAPGASIPGAALPASKLAMVTTKRPALTNITNSGTTSAKITLDEKLISALPKSIGQAARATTTHPLTRATDENAAVPNFKRVSELKSADSARTAVGTKLPVVPTDKSRVMLRGRRKSASKELEAIPAAVNSSMMDETREEEEETEDMSIGSDTSCVAEEPPKPTVPTTTTALLPRLTNPRHSVSELVGPMVTISLSHSRPAAPVPALAPIVVAPTPGDGMIEDIDIADRDDPQQCLTYIEEIMEMMREKERGPHMPVARYMKAQKMLNPKVRGVLVDWMVDVSSQFGLLSETLFLAVQLLDRLLSKKEVSKDRVQLVGITAMIIASKFEETRTPWVDDFIWVSADAYTREDVIRVEKILLVVIDFNLTLPTPLHFLRRFSKAARSDSQTHTISKYLTELSLPEYKMLRFVPSLIAASAVYVARAMNRRTPLWTPTLQYHTKYTEPELRECATMLASLHNTPPEPKHFENVKKKYANPTLLAVSELPHVDLAVFGSAAAS
eukprot:TRINITY_DN6614_c0_g1_i1.p1 TRINITY_DN6614_c0_g1~~TRINITY_DN6614_c0_g1_i1.p1  ORF type:complete len:501 (+),score=97.51 TRINITY_DN6614_c0_g1_i1:232-1734(+)